MKTTIAVAALSLLALPTFAWADDAAPLSLDSAVKLTAYFDDDGTFVKPNGGTDRHYTAGAALSLQWRAPWVDSIVSAIPSFNEEFTAQTPNTSYAMGLIASLNMYTPEDLDNPNPIYNDHPYAGWTYGGLILQRANRDPQLARFEHLELDIGVTGAASQAEAAQKWIHLSFNATTPEGWNHQIREEVGVNLKYQRRYCWEPLPLPKDSSPWLPRFEVLPEAGFTLGTINVDANAGAVLRLGWNLPDDFGPGRIALPADFTRPTAHLTGDLFQDNWLYFYGRPNARAIAHDTTLQGSLFNNSPVEVTPEPVVGEVEFGIALQLCRHFQLTYSQTFRSKEFTDQNAPDSFGSLTASFIVIW